MSKSYQEINAETINRWIEEGWEWGQPISHETYLNAKNGDWNVLLTPVNPVPHEWLGNLKDKKILGLASGGGQQMPVFTALGANCTVLDYSDKQLEEQDCGIQFSHTISEQIGGQLKAGFRLTDIYDDTNGFGRLHELNIASFVATRAIKE